MRKSADDLLPFKFKQNNNKASDFDVKKPKGIRFGSKKSSVHHNNQLMAELNLDGLDENTKEKKRQLQQ